MRVGVPWAALTMGKGRSGSLKAILTVLEEICKQPARFSDRHGGGTPSSFAKCHAYPADGRALVEEEAGQNKGARLGQRGHRCG